MEKNHQSKTRNDGTEDWIKLNPKTRNGRKLAREILTSWTSTELVWLENRP